MGHLRIQTSWCSLGGEGEGREGGGCILPVRQVGGGWKQRHWRGKEMLASLPTGEAEESRHLCAGMQAAGNRQQGWRHMGLGGRGRKEGGAHLLQ